MATYRVLNNLDKLGVVPGDIVLNTKGDRVWIIKRFDSYNGVSTDYYGVRGDWPKYHDGCLLAADQDWILVRKRALPEKETKLQALQKCVNIAELKEWIAREWVK